MSKTTDFLYYAAMCYGASRTMTKEQLQELTDWEADNLDGCTVGTMDWPGWIPLIGHPPHFYMPKKDKPKKKSIPQGLRTDVFERDRYRCLECGTWQDLTIDHIVPEVRGGSITLENLQTLCRPCNSRKGTK